MKNNKFIYIIVLLLTIALLLLSFGAEFKLSADDDPEAVEPEEKDPLEDVRYGACYCVEADLMLYEKDISTQISPWAACKLMNALVVCDAVRDLSEKFEIEKSMIKAGNNVYGLKAGKVVSYFDLIVLELLRGVDDASTVLARKIAGDDDSFIALMNEKAKEIGLTKTMFMNVSGADGTGLSTVQDIVRLSKNVLDNPRLAEIVGKGNIKCETLSDTIFNRNVFLSNYYNNTGKNYINKSVTGLMAPGLVDPSMMIFSEKSEEYNYIIVVFLQKDLKPSAAFDASVELSKQFYGKFSYRTVLSKNDIICELPVKMGYEHDSVVATPDNTFEYFLLSDCDVDSEFSYEYELNEKYLEAPVRVGQNVGTVFLYRNGEQIGSCPLVIRTNVSRSVAEYYKEQVKDVVFGNLFFKIMLVVVIISIIYILIVSIYRGQKQKKERKLEQEENY